MEAKDKEKEETEKNEAKADETDPRGTDVDIALKSFCCYLYVGKGHLYYKAKPWNDDESYTISQRMKCLEVLASNKKTELVPIDKIKLAMDSTLIRRPDHLMFALAMCATQKKSEKLRAAAYYFLAEHCKEWNYFILFIKFHSMLCKMEGSTEKNGASRGNGCGHGWKNAVNKWYLTQSPTSLLQLVTHHKGDHGWRHKDILKLSHPNTMGLEVEKRAIMCYIFHGLGEALKEFVKNPEARKMLAYICVVETFKKCEDDGAAAEFIAAKKFTVDQVHPKALKSKKVWRALLENMDVRTILENLPRLNNLGLLTEEDPATQLVVRSITDESNLRWNKILPGDVLSILNLYRPTGILMYLNMPNFTGFTDEASRIAELMASSYLKDWEDLAKLEICSAKKRKSKSVAFGGKANLSQTNAKLKVDGQTTNLKGPRPIKRPNFQIYTALLTSLKLAQTVDITESNKLTYLVSIAVPGHINKTAVIRAGLAIALPLLHRKDVPENAVTIVGYRSRLMAGLPCKVSKEMNFDHLINTIISLHKFNLERMYMSPIIWAWKEKKKYDVFINVTNEPPSKKLRGMMLMCSRDLGLPQTRIINVIITKGQFKWKNYEWDNALTINGFDPHVPYIIEAYVRGLF